MWKSFQLERPQFKLDKNYINQFEQIAIFVQKTNDMDTCACATALAELITYNDAIVQKKRTIKIIGIHGSSKFLKEVKKYANNEIDWSKKVLAVLSEINTPKQLHKQNLELLQNAAEVVIIDHHYSENDSDENDKLIDLIGHKLKLFEDSTQTSVCEVLWELIKNHNKSFPENSWSLNKRIIEILFMGLYTDSKELTSRTISATTFKHMQELVEGGEINVPEIINKLNQKPVANFRLFVETMKDAEYKKKCVLISLDYRNVFRYLPRLLHKNKDGSLKQKQMLTWIPRWVEQLTDSNTIVFVHYSLYEPFNSARRFVYIILVKENPALEKVLKDCEFKKNRNRWSREMDLYDLLSLMDRYDEIFTS